MKDVEEKRKRKEQKPANSIDKFEAKTKGKTKAKNKTEKPEQPSFFKEMGDFLKPYQGKYAASVVISIISVVASIGAYGFMGKTAAKLFQPNPMWDTVLILAIGAAVCKILHAVLLNWSTWISHQAAYYTLKDIRTAMADKMMKLPMGYFETNGSGRLKTLMVDHVENMEKTLAHMLPELTANLLGPVACLVWMAFIDWRLALIVFIWIIIGLSTTMGMMKDYDAKYAGQINALKTMNQSVVEYVNGIEVIKNFGRGDDSYEKYTNAVYGHAGYNVNWVKETQRFTSLGMAIAPFSLFPVLIGGLIFYQNGTLEPDALFLIVILTFGIFGPIMTASTYFDQLAGMGTNAAEMKKILDYPELVRGASKGPDDNSNLTIDFENVSFGYDEDNEDKLAVDNISFHVEPGTMFALVGPSGSGKSTIAKLLGGYWDAKSGDIRIGGISINDYDQDALNKLIGYVDQETFLFNDTIMNNIRMGNPAASDEQVVEAAKKAGCNQFIELLPEKYETMAGVAGNRLSGGERQRIAIARAMMKDAPIMILDEATASTDPENEASIQEAISAATRDKTLIVVAHRLKTIAGAEQIAYVEGGKIQAVGTHEELLEKHQGYAEMWRLAGEN